MAARSPHSTAGRTGLAMEIKEYPNDVLAAQPIRYWSGEAYRRVVGRIRADLATERLHDVHVTRVRAHEKGDPDTRVDRGRHLRPASIRPNRMSSSTAVSPAATSTPSSSTRRAVLPAGTTCTPAP